MNIQVRITCHNEQYFIRQVDSGMLVHATTDIGLVGNWLWERGGQLGGFGQYDGQRVRLGFYQDPISVESMPAVEMVSQVWHRPGGSTVTMFPWR